MLWSIFIQSGDIAGSHGDAAQLSDHGLPLCWSLLCLFVLVLFFGQVADLTGLPWANASLLDEATAAAEAMFMCFSHVGGDANKKNVFLVCCTFAAYLACQLTFNPIQTYSIQSNPIAADVHPHVMDVVKTRASGLGITVKLIEGAAAADTDFSTPHNQFCFLIAWFCRFRTQIRGCMWVVDAVSQHVWSCARPLTAGQTSSCCRRSVCCP